mgnify:CR=1 FL=1
MSLDAYCFSVLLWLVLLDCWCSDMDLHWSKLQIFLRRELRWAEKSGIEAGIDSLIVPSSNSISNNYEIGGGKEGILSSFALFEWMWYEMCSDNPSWYVWLKWKVRQKGRSPMNKMFVSIEFINNNHWYLVSNFRSFSSQYFISRDFIWMSVSSSLISSLSLYS